MVTTDSLALAGFLTGLPGDHLVAISGLFPRPSFSPDRHKAPAFESLLITPLMTKPNRAIAGDMAQVDQRL